MYRHFEAQRAHRAFQRAARQANQGDIRSQLFCLHRGPGARNPIAYEGANELLCHSVALWAFDGNGSRDQTDVAGKAPGIML